MTKKQNDTPESFDMDDLPITEQAPLKNPSMLINKLCAFYNKHPDYQTGIVDIFTLSHLAAAEIGKFIKRPHKKVTTIYLDREPPMGELA